MTIIARILAVLAFAAAGLAAAAESNAITDANSAVRAAKRFTKGQCTAKVPCTYKAQRDGKQWRVWVRQTKAEAASGGARRTIVLTFDDNGTLLRRLEAD
jgi:hypothetical protein